MVVDWRWARWGGWAVESGRVSDAPIPGLFTLLPLPSPFTHSSLVQLSAPPPSFPLNLLFWPIHPHPLDFSRSPVELTHSNLHPSFHQPMLQPNQFSSTQTTTPLFSITSSFQDGNAMHACQMHHLAHLQGLQVCFSFFSILCPFSTLSHKVNLSLSWVSSPPAPPPSPSSSPCLWKNLLIRRTHCVYGGWGESGVC